MLISTVYTSIIYDGSYIIYAKMKIYIFSNYIAKQRLFSLP